MNHFSKTKDTYEPPRISDIEPVTPIVIGEEVDSTEAHDGEDITDP
jgi:hypothetical protein